MRKVERQKLIMKIIGEKVISTLGQLQKELKGEGVSVDTATISRDVRELGLVRGADETGMLRYTAPGQPAVAATPAKALTSRFVREIDWSGNIIVIKTLSGTAAMVGEILDKLKWKQICGTVAGDNTLIVVVTRNYSAADVASKLKREVFK